MQMVEESLLEKVLSLPVLRNGGLQGRGEECFSLVVKDFRKPTTGWGGLGV